jgi:hypothetical protein
MKSEQQQQQQEKSSVITPMPPAKASQQPQGVSKSEKKTSAPFITPSAPFKRQENTATAPSTKKVTAEPVLEGDAFFADDPNEKISTQKTQTTTGHSPKSTKAVSEHEKTPNGPKMPALDMQLPKWDEKDYDKVLTVASSTAKFATFSAKSILQAVSFVTRESVAFVQKAPQTLDTTTIDDTDMTYKQALEKVTKSSRGIVKLVQVLVQDSAAYASNEWWGNDPPVIGVPTMEDMAANAGSVLGDALSTAFSAWKNAVPNVQDTIQGNGIPGGKAVPGRSTAAEKNDNSHEKKKEDLPYFMKFANDATSSSKLFSTRRDTLKASTRVNYDN